MKKLFVLLTALAVMGGAIAQNDGAKKTSTPSEYVSVLLTFSSRNFPMDSLDAYGVRIQERTGIIAYALIPAENYEAFVNSGIAERVQPSTRVYIDEDATGRPHHGDVEYRMDPRHHGDKDGRRGEDPRRHLIPEEELDNDDASGLYLGILLGDARNSQRVENAKFSGVWYPMHGVDGELIVGYQFNRWFGLRTAVQCMFKNYSTDLKVPTGNPIKPNETKTYSTNYTNMYLQAPLFADFSLGGRFTRLHIRLGGYAGYWVSQYREGFVYSPTGTTGLTNGGGIYGFETGYNKKFDAGVAGGLGLTFRLSPACQLHIEGTYYHGLVSTTVDPYKTFNRTITIDMGVSYHF